VKFDSLPFTPYDLLVSVHCRNIIPKIVLDQLPLGGINVHPNLSVDYGRYKGSNPIGRALADGQSTFSVGVHKMTPRVDHGPVLVEKFIHVSPEESNSVIVSPSNYTPADIYQRIYPLYAVVLSEALDLVARDNPSKK
jgi:methionyl-tRNA formyltransferase